jgi:hypothetical protein
LPRNPDVVESEFACIHINIKPLDCHHIMRDSVKGTFFEKEGGV